MATSERRAKRFCQNVPFASHRPMRRRSSSLVARSSSQQTMQKALKSNIAKQYLCDCLRSNVSAENGARPNWRPKNAHNAHKVTASKQRNEPPKNSVCQHRQPRRGANRRACACSRAHDKTTVASTTVQRARPRQTTTTKVCR